VRTAIRPRATHSCVLPVAVRLRLVHDTAAHRYYAALLTGGGEGRAQAGARWDSVEALRWMAEGEDPRYLPLMLRFARAALADTATPSSRGLLITALHGLGDHARDSSAARGLLDSLARSGGYTDPRLYALYVLLRLNDEPARAVLRAFLVEAAAAPPPPLYGELRRRAPAALAGAPCLPGTKWEEGHGIEGQLYRGCRLPWWRVAAGRRPGG
jgi:hypothetical protein